MAALSTIALTTAAVVGTGYGIHSGERGNAAQKRAVTRQGQMQREAETRAARQQMLGDEQVRAAAARTPNTAALLGQTGAALGGGGMLTGLPDPTQTNRKTLLGG